MEFIRKDIFIILELVIDGIYIDSAVFDSIEHEIAVMREMNDTVSVLF